MAAGNETDEETWVYCYDSDCGSLVYRFFRLYSNDYALRAHHHTPVFCAVYHRPGRSQPLAVGLFRVCFWRMAQATCGETCFCILPPQSNERFYEVVTLNDPGA